MTFVHFENVTRTYRSGDRQIQPLDGLDLRVNEGEFLVLLGPSGSGKSTLLNLVAGIDRPDSGRVVVGGVDLRTLNAGRAADWRAQTVGYVFQDHHLVPVLTAYENIEIPLWLFRMSRADRRRRVQLALEAVGLTERADHLPRQLSGGQAQRVALARSIVADPPLLIADEPTGNLDEEAARDVLTLIGRLHRERSKTILMVTHDPRAAAHATRALRLEKGRLAPFEESTEESTV